MSVTEFHILRYIVASKSFFGVFTYLSRVRTEVTCKIRVKLIQVVVVNDQGSLIVWIRFCQLAYLVSIVIAEKFDEVVS